MQNENTAAATAIEVSPSGPEVENKIAVRPSWTIETFQENVDREQAMRKILQKYMADAMIKDHHYYSFKDGDKPALTQEGAHSICSLMKAFFGPPDNEKEYHPDGHLSVSTRIQVFNTDTGALLATGDGICTTRESKYSYRWVWDNEVPAGMDVSQLKSKSGTKRDGKKWTQYQMPNQDLPDLYNTVLKMAVKRAKVAAVRQLPLVSELFVAEDDDHQGGNPSGSEGVSSRSSSPTPAKGGGRTTAAAASQPSPAPPKETAVDVVCGFVNRLVGLGVPIADLNELYLPAGVEQFSDLTEEQAVEIRQDVLEALNAKLKKS